MPRTALGHHAANGAGPHAATSLSNGDSFAYDANGNIVSRYDAATTTSWTHTFDAENHLVTVSDGSTTTTIYVAGMEIELEGSTESQRTVYYAMGGAFRIIGGSNAGVYYRHTDHLNSTSVLSNSTVQKVSGSDVVYAPFGEVRAGSQSPSPTSARPVPAVSPCSSVRSVVQSFARLPFAFRLCYKPFAIRHPL